MFLMMAEVLRTAEVADALPGSIFWQWVASAQTHVEWMGCSLHDLIQPSFSFLVGVALPFSITSRLARGQEKSEMMLHTLWRALCLILLGVFLRSVGQPETNWTFEDTLTQIGLGYPFLFILGFRSARVQWIALLVILATYWAAWALYPVSGTPAVGAASGIPQGSPNHISGFAAHWNKNANLGAAFDQWFLNLFPRSEPFVANSGGYLTLNFIPTLGTMILGLLAGGCLRNPLSHEMRIRRMLITGVAGVVVGASIHLLGICPLVKRIWTPSWTIFSGGCCFLMLAAFYSAIDWRGWKGWTLPLRVIGMNSIAAYCFAHLFENFIASSLATHLGANAFEMFGAAYAPFVRGTLVLLTFWLILLWMFRRKIFLKI
jgi:predicted acyltransferase